MGRGSDDRPLALERPMPLRVASTEGLGGALPARLSRVVVTTSDRVPVPGQKAHCLSFECGAPICACEAQDRFVVVPSPSVLVGSTPSGLRRWPASAHLTESAKAVEYCEVLGLDGDAVPVKRVVR